MLENSKTRTLGSDIEILVYGVLIKMKFFIVSTPDIHSGGYPRRPAKTRGKWKQIKQTNRGRPISF